MIAGLAYTLLVLSWGSGLPLLMALVSAPVVARHANLFLCVALGSILYAQAIGTFAVTGELGRYPILLGSSYPLLLLSAPALYLYVRAMTESEFRLLPKDCLHLLIPMAGLIWYLVYQSILPPEMIAEMARNLPPSNLRLTVACFPFGAYLFFSYLTLWKHQQRIAHYYSDLSVVRLRWLKLLILFFFTIWAVLVADNLIFTRLRLIGLAFPIVTVGSLLLGVFAMRQSSLLGVVAAPKVQRDGVLSDSELATAKDRLAKCLTEKKLHLNPNLRLTDLADAIQMKPYETSEVVNRAFKKSFYDLINEMRIAEAKARLTDPEFQHMNILGVAFDSGFNSKSSFNEAFKRVTGMTPSEFRSST